MKLYVEDAFLMVSSLLSLQVVYKKDATKVQTNTIKAQPQKPAATAPAAEEEEDDFDIDAI
jgi:hypothetical protein